MDKRNLNISFYKAGNGTSSRLNIPIKWLREMGINENEKSVEVIYDDVEKTICIKKR